MKLSYRGVPYDHTPPSLEMKESEIMATYRGQSYPIRYPRHMTLVQPVADLTYRGVPYRSTVNGGAEPRERTASQPVGASVSMAAAAFSRVDQIHQENLCKRLSARIASARDRGDERLLKLLEQESQQLVCSR
ncbi:DUF4278 domain-containing protein [Phormidium yuhuli AB48]|uniref:DUF4278 domain-containing protein n=1 Tax=Phormidium yuhuli AB48 TaxID=2940671 RepID=A0ABY5ANN6_9CYAN|nr:DUF4278 domain-containing protein [Phormidium yuhuli]USR90823.1 DUF4278 domain-containing protein [Phormidium yuhuli AB48]